MGSRAQQPRGGALDAESADLLAVARDSKAYDKIVADITAQRAEAHEMLGVAQAAQAEAQAAWKRANERAEGLDAREAALEQRAREFEANRASFRQIVADAKAA